MRWIVDIWNLGNELQQKGWYTSKTVWFNILTFVASVAAIKGFNVDANDVAVLASACVSVVNIGLRFSTTNAIGANPVQSGTNSATS